MRLHCETRETSVWRVQLEPNAEGRTLLNPAGLRDLEAVLTRLEAAEHCRVLLLEGVPGEFCSGMDLQAALERREEVADDLRRYAGCLRRLRELACVVVAVADGRVMGGGVGLAAVADLVLATPRASFALPELALGLIPSLVLAVLSERMPPQKARRLVLTGQPISAEKAEAFGLVDQLVEIEALPQTVSGLLRQLLREDPRSVARLKRFSRGLEGRPLSAALEAGWRQTAGDLADPAIRAGLQGYLEGELPPWFERRA